VPAPSDFADMIERHASFKMPGDGAGGAQHGLHCLEIRVVKARYLRDMQAFGTQNPRATVTVGSTARRTARKRALV
jgi:hypothetical protein